MNCLCGHNESCVYCEAAIRDLVPIERKSLKKIEKMLNSTITNLLYGGCADPGWSECEGAAACFKTLKLLGLKVKNEQSIREELSDPQRNVSETNFLKKFNE